MQEVTGDDGCPVFQGSVSLDLADSAKTFKWGVLLDGPSGANFWGIPTEVQDVHSTERHREFQLVPGGGTQTERYFLTHCRRLGANKHTGPGGITSLVFAAWAPNSGAVDVVFGRTSSGYIGDDGSGIDPAMPVVSLSSQGGVWEGVAPWASIST